MLENIGFIELESRFKFLLSLFINYKNKKQKTKTF